MGIDLTQLQAGIPAVRTRLLRYLLGAVLACIWGTALGQLPMQEPATPLAQDSTTVTVQERLPGIRNLAAALSDESSRNDTLLTLLALAQLEGYASLADAGRLPELEARFRDDRTWLDRLAARFTALPQRPSLLDPAAWFVARQLDRHGLAPEALISPLGPDDAAMLRQLFDRGDELLAATVLPELLRRIEFQSVFLWQRLLTQLPADPALALLLSQLNSDWFDPWVAAEPPSPGSDDPSVDPVSAALDYLRAIAGSAMTVGPPDALRLKRLRFELLTALPTLDEAGRRDAAHLLALATAMDDLYRGNFMEVTGALLWVTTDLLLGAAEPPSAIARALSEIVPGLSNAYAAGFAAVDPRLNAALATVFDVVQYLQAPARDPLRMATLRQGVGDTVAQLVLLIPDMDYYFEQPVRERIAEEIDICIGAMSGHDPAGSSTLSRQQFESCLDSLVQMAAEQASRAELAGDPNGPFGTEQLRRELMLTPWQRINYVLGYLLDRHPTACRMPAAPLPNPLEWASLVSTIAWFSSQAPVYFQTPKNEARIADLRRDGLELLSQWAAQVECLSSAGPGLGDPISRGLADYRHAQNQLVAGLREAELAFRAAHLKPGSDIMLHGDATQRTAFRNEQLVIGPCDPAQICEMNGTLEATRALIGLFPDPYLIADQSGLGEIEICYRNVRWVDRRSEPVREDDPHVANYYGHLSLDLVGRYHEDDATSEVFGFNFVSPGEFHYLFAAASDEVLADDCPTEWVGSRIVTSLGDNHRARVVPDRLTYLAAARSLPSQVLNANWSRREEWRDAFVTGRDVTAFELPADPGIADRVNQHLQDLYQAEQAEIYNAMFQPDPLVGDSDSLAGLLESLRVSKALLRSYMNLFYPQLMVDSDEIRGYLEGQGSLLGFRVLRRFRESNVAVSSINETGLTRLEGFQALWNRQPDAVRRSGTSAISVAHAIVRLSALYQQYFVAPAEPASEAQPETQPEAPSALPSDKPEERAVAEPAASGNGPRG